MKVVYGSTTYTFPTYTGLTGLSFDVRNNEVKRAFTHGSTDNGDGKIESRIVEIESFVEADTEAGYRSALSAIKAAVYRRDYQLYLDDDRYINVTALDKWKETYIKGFRNKGFATMAFRCCDPFFYELTETSAEQTANTNPYSFVVNNPGTVDTPLIIEIAPTGNAYAITITNETDGNRALALNDTSLTSPAVAIINAVDGTVYRGSSNTINAFTGAFLRLLPGNNTISYTGDPVAITTRFTARYL